MRQSILAQWDDKVIPMEIEKRARWNEGEILPPNEILCGIFGSSGQGKTMITLQLLIHIAPKLLKYVIVLSRIEGNPVYDAIENWCKKTEKKYYFSSNVEEGTEIIERVINEKAENEHVVILFDDFNEGCITSRSNKYTKLTNELYTKGRNYNVHMIFLVQRYCDLSTVARSNLNMIITFKMLDKYARRELSKDFSTLIDRYAKGENLFKELHKKISKVKHSYFIGTSGGVWIFIHEQMKRIQKVAIEGEESDSE